MGGWLPLLVSLPFIVTLLYSGLWTSRRYARFNKLPGHYDITGRPTRMAPRRTMVWLLPILFSFSLAVIALLTLVIPKSMQNGDPTIGVIVGGVGLLGGQLFVLRLTEKWARSQP